MNHGPTIRLVGALIILALVFAGYGYWYSLLSAKSAEAAALSIEITQKSNATSKIDAAKAELSQLSSQESSINQYFVATNDVVPFLEEIQAIGKFLGADVEVASVSAIPGTPFGQLSLSLTITGTFDAVARTIGSIEYGPYDTQIKSLTFNETSGSGTTLNSAPVWAAAAVFTIGAQTGNPQSGAADTNSGTNTAVSSAGGVAQAQPAPSAASTSVASSSVTTLIAQ